MTPKQTFSLILPRHPLDIDGVVKIALGSAASAALRAIGPRHLCITTESDATAPPEAHGRLVLVCLPLTRERAFDVSRVALGSHKAVRVNPPASTAAKAAAASGPWSVPGRRPGATAGNHGSLSQ